MSRRFYRWPGPGEIRGEGEWREAVGIEELKFWDYCRQTGWLPTKEEPAEGFEEAKP